VEVTEGGSNRALFMFTNTGPEACSITDVFFADGDLFGTDVDIESSPGVSFTEGSSPPILSGAPQDFKTSQFFSADSVEPPPDNGVEAGYPVEWLRILFNLQSDREFDEVLTELGSEVVL